MERFSNTFNNKFYNNAKPNKKMKLKFNFKNKKHVGIGILSTLLTILISLIVIKLVVYYLTQNCKKMNLVDYLLSLKLSISFFKSNG